MKRGRFVSFTAAALIAFTLCGQAEAVSFENSGIGDIFEDAAAGISEAAGSAGEAIGEAAGSAGEAIGGAASQAGDIALGFASNAGEVMKQWSENAEKTSETVKKALQDAGIAITVEASELANSTIEKSTEILNMAGSTVDDAIAAVSNAGDYVLDQAGHVVDMASIGIGNASREASQALDALMECGTQLVEIAGDAVDGLDLDNEAVWNQAEQAIHKAIKDACNSNILPIRPDEETITILSDIMLEAAKGGYRCSKGQITLGDYTHGMSDVIIRNGIPAGVGTIAGLLTGGNGTAMKLAREATFLIITSANSDPTDVRPLWEVDQD